MAMSEKEQEALARRKVKYDETISREIDAFLTEAFKSHAGRATIWWLLELGRVNTQPFRGQPDKTAFACGELNVGNRILSRVVSLNPDGYVNMLKEKDRERRELINPAEHHSAPGEPGGYSSAAADNPSLNDGTGQT